MKQNDKKYINTIASYSKSNSTTTRIETHYVRMIHIDLIHILNQIPLQQGLKRGLGTINMNQILYSKSNSTTTRIETHFLFLSKAKNKKF